MPTPATFAAQDLAARRGQSLLWQGVGFAVAAGGALVVRGANGAGKTTLLRILAGLTHAAHGTLEWRGLPVQPFAQALRDEVVYIGHAPALKDELSARENLVSLSRLAADRASAARIDAALAAVDLVAQASLPARVLSQGQRRRVHLALLPLSTRSLWILDEPAATLDAQGLAWLETTLAAHFARGGIAALSTHTPIAIAADRVTGIAL